MESQPAPIDFSSFHNIINGELRIADQTHNGINPATREKLWNVPCATETDVDDAVKCARKAFPSWSQTSWDERCNVVRRYAEAYLNVEEEMTELLMKETGKPVSAAELEDLPLFVNQV